MPIYQFCSVNKIVSFMIRNLLFTLVFILFLFGCGDSHEVLQLRSVQGGRFFGGTLHLSKTEYIHTLYPPAIIDPISARVASQIYEGLFYIAPDDFSVRPLLVESFEINQDSTVYTFRLKKGVYFHDDPCFPTGKGRELKASDVEYCFTQLCQQTESNQGFVLFKGILKNIDSYHEASGKKNKTSTRAPEAIQVLDDYSIRLILEKPYSQLLIQLARPQALIYPREEIYKYGTKRAKAVGTGPFVLLDVERFISIRLERNPRYHRYDAAGNRLPYLDGIYFQFIPDKRSELAEFKSGNLQMMYHLPPEQFTQILRMESDGTKPPEWRNALLVHKPELVTHYLAFNLQNSFFKNHSLRKAFAHSLDKTTILGTTLSGEGLAPATYGITPPLFKNYPTTQIKGLAESLDSARQYLSNAPLPDTKPNLAFYPDGSRNTSVAIAVAEQIKNALGIEINLDPQPLTKLYDNLLASNFDIVLLPKTTEYYKPISFLEPFYGKNTISSHGKTYPNFFHYQNALFDEGYAKALTARTETETATALRQAEQILINDAAIIPLWYDEGYYLLKKNVKNFSVNTMVLRNFTEVYFVPEAAPDKKNNKPE